jgi:hypothetical protein
VYLVRHKIPTRKLHNFGYTFADDRAGQVTGQGVQGFFVATPGLAPIAGSSASAGSSAPAGTVPAATSGSGYGY